MKQQTYVSEEEQTEFIENVKSFKEKDPRLKPPKIAIQLGVSPSYFGRVVRGDARLSKDLYQRWFETVEPKLERRVQRYEKMSLNDLVAFVKENLPEYRKKAQGKIRISDEKIYSSLFYKRANTLLNIYDAINGLPPYEEKVARNENEIVDELNREVNEIMGSLHLELTDLNALGYYLYGDKKWLLGEILRTPSRKLQKKSRDIVREQLPKLRKFCSYANEYQSQFTRRHPKTDKMVELTGEDFDTLNKDCQTFFGKNDFLKNNQGNYAKTISLSKMLMVLSMEKIEHATSQQQRN